MKPDERAVPVERIRRPVNRSGRLQPEPGRQTRNRHSARQRRLAPGCHLVAGPVVIGGCSGYDPFADAPGAVAVTVPRPGRGAADRVS